MPLFVAGLSHKNAPVGLREQLAVEEDKLRELLRDIQSDGVLPEPGSMGMIVFAVAMLSRRRRVSSVAVS